MEEDRRTCLIVEQAMSEENTILSGDTLQHTSIPISEILSRSGRLEASIYGIEGKRARAIVANSPWPKRELTGKKGIAEVSYPSRFKRIFLDHSNLPIFQPSQITDQKPQPNLYISELTPTDIEGLRVKRNQILLTRSGTIGTCALVSKSYENQIFSDDLLRITCYEETDAGYLYAFLKSKVGHTLVVTNNYGAVVQHIEPQQLESLEVPYPSYDVRSKINELIIASYQKRDEANELINNAEKRLKLNLLLPDLQEFESKDGTVDINSVSVNDLEGRLEAHYHQKKIERIITHLKKNSKQLVRVGDEIISSEIILPGRFKRTYVNEGQGIVFFGGKQVYELDPSDKKYLSLKLHDSRIKHQLTLEQNSIMITRSGTIGRVQITPKHWSGWTANEHIIRIIPSNSEIAGYLYVWLQSDYGEVLIKRFKYGAVVDELDTNQMGAVEIPLLLSTSQQLQINNMALKANELRYKAYILEQQAIELMQKNMDGGLSKTILVNH